MKKRKTEFVVGVNQVGEAVRISREVLDSERQSLGNQSDGEKLEEYERMMKNTE